MPGGEAEVRKGHLRQLYNEGTSGEGACEYFFSVGPALAGPNFVEVRVRNCDRGRRAVKALSSPAGRPHNCTFIKVLLLVAV